MSVSDTWKKGLEERKNSEATEYQNKLDYLKQLVINKVPIAAENGNIYIDFTCKSGFPCGNTMYTRKLIADFEAWCVQQRLKLEKFSIIHDGVYGGGDHHCTKYRVGIIE